MKSLVPKESEIQRAILDYLAAEHILAFRMNTGAVKTDERFFRFGVPGMADILAFTEGWYPTRSSLLFHAVRPLWIECKAPAGRQSDLQRSFQRLVEEHGHRYIIARSVEDVMAALASQP